MIMKLGNVSASECDQWDLMYPIICPNHWLHGDNGHKKQHSRDRYKAMYNNVEHATTDKCNNNGKGWCFRFDDKNKKILPCHKLIKLNWKIYDTCHCFMTRPNESYFRFDYYIFEFTSRIYLTQNNKIPSLVQQAILILLMLVIPNIGSIPVDTRRNKNVFVTSKRSRRRRFDEMKTLSLRHYCVMCLLGHVFECV